MLSLLVDAFPTSIFHSEEIFHTADKVGEMTNDDVTNQLKRFNCVKCWHQVSDKRDAIIRKAVLVSDLVI